MTATTTMSDAVECALRFHLRCTNHFTVTILLGLHSAALCCAVHSYALPTRRRRAKLVVTLRGAARRAPRLSEPFVPREPHERAIPEPPPA